MMMTYNEYVCEYFNMIQTNESSYVEYKDINQLFETYNLYNVLNNNKLMHDSGNECQCMIDLKNGITYKCYNILQDYINGINSGLNTQYARFFTYFKIKACSKYFDFYHSDFLGIIKTGYLVFIQEYVPRAIRLSEKIRVTKLVYNTLKKYNKNTKIDFAGFISNSSKYDLKYNNVTLLDVNINNVTQKNNKLFFYDINLNHAGLQTILKS